MTDDGRVVAGVVQEVAEAALGHSATRHRADPGSTVDDAAHDHRPHRPRRDRRGHRAGAHPALPRRARRLAAHPQRRARRARPRGAGGPSRATSWPATWGWRWRCGRRSTTATSWCSRPGTAAGCSTRAEADLDPDLGSARRGVRHAGWAGGLAAGGVPALRRARRSAAHHAGAGLRRDAAGGADPRAARPAGADPRPGRARARDDPRRGRRHARRADGAAGADQRPRRARRRRRRHARPARGRRDDLRARPDRRQRPAPRRPRQGALGARAARRPRGPRAGAREARGPVRARPSTPRRATPYPTSRRSARYR